MNTYRNNFMCRFACSRGQLYMRMAVEKPNPPVFSYKFQGIFNSSVFSELGPIRTSRQNRNCPWQNPRTNFVVTIFISSVASTLTWLKSSNCVVGWQLACLKNCSSQSVSLQHVDSQTGHHQGDITAAYRIRLFI